MSRAPCYRIDETAYLDALAAGRDVGGEAEPAFDSFGDLLDHVMSVHPEIPVPTLARPPRRTGEHLHLSVRLQLQRLRAEMAPTAVPDGGWEEITPAGRYRVPPAIAEFGAFRWPTG